MPIATCPASVIGLFDEPLHFLQTSTDRDHERIGHVDDHEIVHTQARNKAARSRYDNSQPVLKELHARVSFRDRGRKVGRTEPTVPKDAGLVRLCRQEFRDRRSNVIPTCQAN